MKVRRFSIAFAVVVLCTLAIPAQSREKPARAYLGFDRNDYPGDANLTVLHRTFAFTGYWLNNPPGENANTWKGKRLRLLNAGFGFVVLFNGKAYAQIRSGDPVAQGQADGTRAARAAAREGFPRGTVIFLDQEEGGRLLPEQRAYLHTWVDAVTAGGYRAGVYCSGVPFKEGDGTVVITAEDIRNNAGGRKIVYWVSNDACPPSPGCIAKNPPPPAHSGVSFVDIWQYAQSPRRAELTKSCTGTYASDGECYVPGISKQRRLHVDLSSATSADPSHGRGDR